MAPIIVKTFLSTAQKLAFYSSPDASVNTPKLTYLGDVTDGGKGFIDVGIMNVQFIQVQAHSVQFGPGVSPDNVCGSVEGNRIAVDHGEYASAF